MVVTDILNRLLNRGGQPPATQNQTRTTEEIADLVESIRARARELRQEAAQDSRSGRWRRQSVDLDAEKEAIKAAQASILEDIVAMHERLGTGLTREQLVGFRETMLKLHEKFCLPAGDLDHRIRRAVACYFHQNCAILAWERLEQLMSEHALQWPDPGGLSPNSDAHEREEARRRDRDEAHDDLVSNTILERTADLLLGIVPVWKSAYPEPGSNLRLRLVLRAVAAGLLAELDQRAQALVIAHRQELEDRVQRMLSEEMQTLQQFLDEGVTSIMDADQAVAAVSHLCEEVIPEVCWALVGPELTAS